MHHGIWIKQENSANRKTYAHRTSFQVMCSAFKTLVLLQFDSGAVGDFLLCESKLLTAGP